MPHFKFFYCKKCLLLFTLQEGPEKISVSDAFMRTTSSLEAYNKTLGDSVVSRAQFFSFVLALRSEEYKTSNALEMFIKSGGLRRNCAQKKQYKVCFCFFSN